MQFEIREMTINDYDQVYEFWQGSEGIGLSDSDSKESISHFISRNQGLSFVVFDGDKIIGAVLCGQDGRRGYIHHLAVLKSYQRQGLGRALVGRCLFALMREGIQKCHLFVFDDNQDAIAFWNNIGWSQRVELVTMSQGIASGG